MRCVVRTRRVFNQGCLLYEKAPEHERLNNKCRVKKEFHMRERPVDVPTNELNNNLFPIEVRVRSWVIALTFLNWSLDWGVSCRVLNLTSHCTFVAS